MDTKDYCNACNRHKEVSYQGLFIVEYQCPKCEKMAEAPPSPQTAPKLTPVLYSLTEIQVAAGGFPFKMLDHWASGKRGPVVSTVRNSTELNFFCGVVDKGISLFGDVCVGWELVV